MTVASETNPGESIPLDVDLLVDLGVPRTLRADTPAPVGGIQRALATHFDRGGTAWLMTLTARHRHWGQPLSGRPRGQAPPWPDRGRPVASCQLSTPPRTTTRPNRPLESSGQATPTSACDTNRAPAAPTRTWGYNPLRRFTRKGRSSTCADPPSPSRILAGQEHFQPDQHTRPTESRESAGLVAGAASRCHKRHAHPLSDRNRLRPCARTPGRHTAG